MFDPLHIDMHRRRLFQQEASILILDEVSGALYAWSNRKLKSSYYGNAGQFTKDGISFTEIGFNGQDLNNSAMDTYSIVTGKPHLILK